MFTKLLSIILIVVLALSFSTAVIAQEDIPGKAEPGNPLAEWLESFNDEMWTNFNKVPSPVLFPLNAQRQSREMSFEEMGSRVRATIDNALENLRNEVKVT